MKPIGGEVTGGAFIGDGEASMTPPNRTQRFMLNKYSGSEVLKEPFTEAVFRFSDGTDRTIRALGRAGEAGAVGDRASEILKDRNARLDGTREWHLELQFLENRMSRLKGQDYFVADFHTAKHDWLTYKYDPQQSHENVIMASATLGAKGRRYLIPWAQWHESPEYDQAGHYVITPDHDGPRVIRIAYTDMTVDLPTTKEVDWKATIRIDPLMENLRALRFDLDNNADYEKRWYDDFRSIKVVAVTDASGQALPFTHKKDQLLVILNEPARAGTPLTLTVEGKAEVIYQLTAESFGLLPYAWYPQYGYINGRSPFHWIVQVPKPYLVTGSGKIVREFEAKDTGQNGIETGCEFRHLPYKSSGGVFHFRELGLLARKGWCRFLLLCAAKIATGLRYNRRVQLLPFRGIHAEPITGRVEVRGGHRPGRYAPVVELVGPWNSQALHRSPAGCRQRRYILSLISCASAANSRSMSTRRALALDRAITPARPGHHRGPPPA